MIGLVFGAYGAHFVRLLQPKSAKGELNRIQIGPKQPNLIPKGTQKETNLDQGGARSPKRRVKGGVANQVAIKTLQLGRTSSKWDPNGTIFGTMWRISGNLFNVFSRQFFH